MSASSNSIATSLPAVPAAPRTVIGPSLGHVLSPRELWRYRDLLWLLAVRDVQVRYRQAFLGMAWAILQPVASMIVLQLVFGRWMRLDAQTGGVPYPIFLYAGLVPWMFFASAVSAATGSFVGNASIVQKVYFPRLIIPLASLGAPLVDYLLAMSVMAGLMLWYGTPLSFLLLLTPLLVGMTILAALGVGVLLAALTVRFRDFRHIVPFMLQIWFFLTPVIVPQSALPAADHWLWRLNPMAGTITAFRAVTLSQPLDLPALAVSATASLLLLALGLWVFARNERSFADVI